VDDLEIGVQFGEDLPGDIDVLAADEDVVGAVVALLENALGGDFAGDGVSQAAFAGDDDGEKAGGFVAEAVHLADGGREVGQMFEDVDGQDAVEIAVGEIQGLLAIADADLDIREGLAEAFGHVGSAFHGDVIALLLLAEGFIFEVFAQAGADFQGAEEAGGAVFGDVLVGETVGDAESVGEHVVPVLHEFVADALIIRRDGRELLGPFWHGKTFPEIRRQASGLFRRGGRRLSQHCHRNAFCASYPTCIKERPQTWGAELKRLKPEN